jgi:hypothetical protein
MLVFGEERRLRLGSAFVVLFENAVEKLKESAADLLSCQKQTGMTLDELEEQARAMRQFYHETSPTAPKTPYYDDEICEILLAREILIQYVDELLYSGIPSAPNSWNKLREFLAAKTDGRINSKSTPSVLDARLEDLLARANQTIDKWITTDGEHTQHFNEWKEKYALRQLGIVKYELWKVWAQRKWELDQLHNSSVMGT